MFSTVFMKILEMRPKSYDQRMHKMSRGRVQLAKEKVAGEVPNGSHVLDIGCGTGELACLMIKRGCTIEGFDVNPSMIQVAKEKIETDHLQETFRVSQMGVEGMDRLAGKNYDAVVSTLVFSELNENERQFALKHTARVLKPGGRLIVADEVVPRPAIHRFAHTMVRLPALVVTYIVAGRSTRPIKDLAGEIAQAKFTVAKEERFFGDSLAILVGFKDDKKVPS